MPSGNSQRLSCWINTLDGNDRQRHHRRTHQARQRPSQKNWVNNGGAKEPCLGVKVEDLKKIQKRVKLDYQLALELYETGIADAMYLAGLIADDAKMTRKDLQKWIEGATCN